MKMDWFAEFCIWIKAMGVGQKVYMSFHYLSVAVAAVFFIWLGRKMKVSRRRVLMALIIDSVIAYALMLLIGWSETGFSDFGRRNFVTVFAWGPLITLVGAKVAGVPWRKLCAMHAPEMLIVHAVSRPGCMIVGCCKGFECGFGIYNVKENAYLFPIQAVEMLIALALAAVLIYILKRHRYEAVRWLYPFMLSGYGMIQFVCDFYRDNEKVYGIYSQRGMHALFMIFVGIVWLGVIYCRWTKEQERKNRFKKKKHRI